MRYKVGDYVEIKESLNPMKHYGGWLFIREMKKHMGNIARVEEVHENHYTLNRTSGRRFAWTDGMVKKASKGKVALYKLKR